MLRRTRLPPLARRRYTKNELSSLIFLASTFGLSSCGGDIQRLNQSGKRESNLQLNAAEAPPRVPLSTRGRYIVDSDGNRFKLRSVNWFGANDSEEVQQGLSVQPIETIISLIKAWGLNSVRLPFSNEMLRQTEPVADALVAANPQFRGLTPLEVFDETIEALTDAGIVVVLNNHTTYSGPCCGYDLDGLWHHTGSSSVPFNQTTAQWENDWLALIRRYKTNKLVAGADLRNEVRTMKTGDTIIPVNPNWGSGDVNDWHKASRDAGRKILAENPDMLIIVEGINWQGSIPALGAYRPGLMPVRVDSIQLQKSNKLVYGYHTYPFTGPRHNGDRTGGTSDGYKTYAEIADDSDPTRFVQAMDEEWAYVLEDMNHFTAPVWVSEFGVHIIPADENYRVWFTRFVDTLVEKDAGYAWWALNAGSMSIITDDWASILPETDWRYDNLRRLFNHDGVTGQIPEQVAYSQVRIDATSDNLSDHLRGTDWRSGHNKGTCRDGERLVGVSTGYRGLCTKDVLGDLWDESREYIVLDNQVTAPFPRGRDWGHGFFKYECPQGYYFAGFSKRASRGGFTGGVCAKANRSLSNQCNSVWMFGSTTRLSQQGGDWALGRDKAQCADDQYLAGVARRTGGSSPTLAFCCGGQQPRPMALKGRWLTNRCMDIVGGVMQNGSKIEIRDCSGADNQLWFYDRDTGQFRSKQDSNYCLDNGGQYNGNGGEMQIWQCHDGYHTNQSFDFDEHLIRNRANRGYAVGAAGSGNNGVRVNIWRTLYTNTQRWAEDYIY